MGFSAVDIANRVGHESVKVTYRYAHMFPNKYLMIAKKLNISRNGEKDEQEKSRSERTFEKYNYFFQNVKRGSRTIR